jgi:hypothetical protein
MTIQSSGPIAVSNISTEIGQAPTYTTSLSFLNGQIKPSVRPATPTMSAFYGLSFFQNSTEGNCANGNCTENCNCGNIQCTNCLIAGGVDCVNCDPQPFLQTGANCACTYNCTTSEVSYACNCACNCSKIICSKMHEKGLMAPVIFSADQAYGRWLYKNDKAVYRGYIRWARIVTAWMDGKGPDFMFWIKDPVKRSEAQKLAITKMAINIGTPWSEHMAYLMGALKQDNFRGRVLMTIGVPICRFLDKIPRVREKSRRHTLPVLYAMWVAFYLSHWTAGVLTKVHSLLEKFSAKDVSHAKID